ncbi:MAG: 2-polyprenylphenol 6-hydroxylase [Thermodesulfobacteriota bacterium]
MLPRLSTIRNFLRLYKILATLLKYGFGGLIEELRVLPFFSFLDWFFFFRRAGKGISAPIRIRLVLEELGPTFVKLGQVLSTRADLLPSEWIDEFKKLQDMVPPFRFEDVKKTIERSFRSPIEKKFLSFEEIPIASASIAQVHYAVLPDGAKVAVKVRRPNIEGTISADVSVMYSIARLLDKHVPASRRLRPIEVVDEFARVIYNELDLALEGSNAALFARLFKDDPRVKVPKVYWDYTLTEVLTMERIEGVPLDEVEAIKAKGFDIEEIAVYGVKLFFKQVFEHGFFHADMHPGNIFVTDDGAMAYLDFGIVGRLDRDLRRYLASMLFYLVRQDYHRMAIIHKEMGLIGANVDMTEFEHALMDIAEPLFGKSLDDINISTFLLKLIHTAKRFDVKLQPNLLLLQKTMVVMEGVGRQLYPSVNMWEIAKPLVYRWMIKQKFSPGIYVEKGREFAEEVGSALFDLPSEIHSILKASLKDELNIGFIHHRLEPLSGEISDAGRRVAGGFIMGALFLGSSVLAAIPNDIPKVMGVPYISALGFLFSALIGFRLLTTLSRNEDRRP